ncbi:MAG: MFS transporter [Candidatus Paracaedibacter sp.]
MEEFDKKTFRKIFATSYVGNCLETYDYVLLGVLLPRLSGLFIGDASVKETFFFGLFAFMAAGLARPLGSIFFGHIGDKYGRKNALFWTLIGMSICSIGIALLPSYSEIGVVATVLFMLFRIGQGISVGGEGLGGAVYLLESMTKDEAKKISAVYASSNPVGALLAIALSLVISHPIFPEWSWKCLFLLGGLVGVVGFIVRRTLPDTPAFERSRETNELSRMPIGNLLASSKTQLFLGTLYVGISSSLAFLGYTFLNIYLQKIVVLTQSVALGYALFAVALSTLSMLTFGLFINTKYSIQSVIRTGGYFVILASYPMIYLLTDFGFWGILISIILLALMTGCFMSLFPLYLSSLFPTSIRYSGASLSNNLASAIIGNAYPLYAFWVIDLTGDKSSPALLLIVFSASFLICSRLLSVPTYQFLPSGGTYARYPT